LVKPRPYETSPDADVLYRAVAVDGALRRLIVTAPKTPGRHPAVLYLTGIGCFSQEAPPGGGTSETKLLYGLTRAGYVTLRVEKSGIGDSEGPSCSDPAYDLRAELQGYLAGLKALKQYPFVDPANVFVLGLSIGGVMAPQVANEEAVRGVVVVNTVSKPFLVYLLETRQRQMLLRHTPYDEIERRLRLDESCNHAFLLEDRNPAEVVKANADCADFIEYPAPYTYMREWAQLNIAETWKKVTAPVLIAYGTSDYVASNGDHPYLAGMLNSFHPGQATLKAIPGMDHYLTKAASMEASMQRASGVEGEFDPEILTVVQEWMDAARNQEAKRNDG
jgi:alpha-beta hydrolase superfamily lysophospholipase